MPFVFREELRPLFNKIVPSAVEIFYDRGFGAGVVLTASGLILTANHVVDGAKLVRVRRCRLMKDWRLGKGRRYLADVIYTNKKADIAIVKVRHPPKLVAATIGSSRNLRIDAPLFRVGADENPLGSGYLKSKGIQRGIPEFTVSMNADAGSSGGPIFDQEGKLIAIALCRIQDTNMPQMISYAIPINAVMRYVRRRRMIRDLMAPDDNADASP